MTISTFLSRGAYYIWLLMIPLLIYTHLHTSFRTRFIQRKLGRALRLSFGRKHGGDDRISGDISPFSALMTALSSTIGTGNIIGVASAVVIGGPGAVFWCWISGVLGMATSYAESLLSVRYRVREKDGTYSGGAMYTLSGRLNRPKLGAAFAAFAVLCSFGIGNSVQSNAISGVLNGQFGLNIYIVAAITAVIALVMILGGIQSIAKACGIIVPFMALMYMAACSAVLINNYAYLSETFSVIIKEAFGVRAVLGGAAGGGLIAAMRTGISRGLFSSEAGLGSAPIAAASSKTNDPSSQALISMTGTFWDTVVICALTGITVVSESLRYPAILHGKPGDIALSVFSRAIPYGGRILALCLTLFAFSTIIGWSHYGERALRYFTGSAKSILFYKITFSAVVFIGAVVSFGAVWSASDILNACMAIPNLISIRLLSRELR